MAVLLLAEVTDGELSLDATAKAVSAATKLGDVTVLCAGASAAAAAGPASAPPWGAGGSGRSAIDALVRWGTISPEDLDLFRVCSTPEEAFDFLKDELDRIYLAPGEDN